MQEAYGEEMAKINGFSDGQLSYTDFIDNFVDKDVIADYAADAMASMVKAGIIKGSDNGGVNPAGYATRAEVAVMCGRLLALM